MTLSLIVAMTDERVIGFKNQLPWHISEDLKRFKRITMGHSIVMGRKTYESIGTPLPGRQNIVVTRNKNFHSEGIQVAHSLPEAINLCSSHQGEKFIIGGSQLFESSLPLADKLYLTLIHHKFQGDAYFPNIDLENSAKILERTEHQTPPPDSYLYSYIVAQLTKRG